MQLEELFRGFGLSVFMAEFITLFLVLLVISIIFWLAVGRFKLHSALCNIYLSFALVQVLPAQMMEFGKNIPALAFLILLVALTLLGKFTFDIHLSGSGLSYWKVFLMSFLEVGAIFSILIGFISDKELLRYISKDALFYFSSPWAKFAWLALPLLFLIYINKSE
ncbi:MAG: hypothetical protein WCJ51_00705 [Candidatus Moraniibacteriota bacterium]